LDWPLRSRDSGFLSSVEHPTYERIVKRLGLPSRKNLTTPRNPGPQRLGGARNINMTTEFAAFGLRPTLIQALEELEYNHPTPVQEAVIPQLMAGRDVIAQARTGTGKTAAFALPALHSLDSSNKEVQVLILSPTRELALQVGKTIEGYAKHHQTQVLTIYGGASYGYQKGTLRKGASIVVGTPGRLLDLMRQGNLKLDSVKLLILDEADEMLSMGFTEEVEEIVAQLPKERQTALFSATLPREIQALADKATNKPVKVNLSQEISTKSVELSYYVVKDSDKAAAVTRLFEMQEVKSALIFCRTRVQTSIMAAELTRVGIPAEALSGAMDQDTREHVLRRFRAETFAVLVATDVAARGLDIDHLSHVVNLDLPQNPDTFVHRIGRVGRAGRSGVAITLITPKEEWKLQRIERALKRNITLGKVPTSKEISRKRTDHLFAKMEKWLTSDRCRKELVWVEELAAAGHDPKIIAAAALKLAAASEKERPIAEMSEGTTAEKPSKAPRPRVARGAEGSGDSVQMMATIGKTHGLNPKEILFALTKIAKVPGPSIGNIRITKTRSFVDVAPDLVNKVLNKNGQYKIGKRAFTFSLDSGKP
jgi:ATP-dependent RNA helicase DeaD